MHELKQLIEKNYTKLICTSMMTSCIGLPHHTASWIYIYKYIQHTILDSLQMLVVKLLMQELVVLLEQQSTILQALKGHEIKLVDHVNINNIGKLSVIGTWYILQDFAERISNI